MMVDVLIRAASSADTEALIDLKAAMNQAEFAAMPPASPLRADRDMTREAAARGVAAYRALIESHGGAYFVAEVDGMLAGCVCWYRTAGSASIKAEVRDHGMLSGLVVDPAYRNLGIGRQLMEAVEAEVRRLGITRLALGVTADNATAQAVYAAAGYTATQISMMKTLA
jgi:ribosomal protein S18 acetylase RimI-like enzyme